MRLLHPFIAVAALALGGCSALLDFDCANDGDCANLEGYICQSGACVERQAPEVCGGEALINELCTELYGPPGATTSDRAAAYIADPEAYALIGVHVPTGGFAGQAEEPVTKLTELTIEEIQAGGGFGDLSDKRIAALVCTDGVTAPEEGIAAGLHATSCGAKVLVGAYENEPTVRLFNEVAKIAGVPLISPGAISPEIANARAGSPEAQKDLMWRIKVPGDVVTRATGQMIRGLRDQLDAGEDPDPAPWNVVVLGRANDQYSSELYQALRGGLCEGSTINCDEQLLHHEYTGEQDAARQDVSGFLIPDGQARDIDLIITLAPNLDDLLQMLLAVGDWVEARGDAPKADIITVEGARSSLGLLGYASTATSTWLDVACRTVGISSGSIGPAREAWEVNINLAGIELLAPVPPFGDALVVASLAMAASMAQFDGEVTTDGIIGGLLRMAEPDENTPAVTVNDWPTGLDLAGTVDPTPLKFDFKGASGEVDFNPDTRDVDDDRVEAWVYAIGNGELNTTSLGLRDVDRSLIGEDGIDLTVLTELQRSHDPWNGPGLAGSDPACAAYPYRLLVPNPPAAE